MRGIPISKSLLEQFFREDKPKNAFRYIVEVIKDVRANGKIPILIIDELQKIGDVKIDSYLIYELFNLFIRLTKELHIFHVFAIQILLKPNNASEFIINGEIIYYFGNDKENFQTITISQRVIVSSTTVTKVKETPDFTLATFLISLILIMLGRRIVT